MERAAHPAPHQKLPGAQRGRPHRFWNPRQTRSLGARGTDPKQHIKRTHGLELRSTDKAGTCTRHVIQHARTCQQ